MTLAEIEELLAKEPGESNATLPAEEKKPSRKTSTESEEDTDSSISDETKKSLVNATADLWIAILSFNLLGLSISESKGQESSNWLIYSQFSFISIDVS